MRRQAYASAGICLRAGSRPFGVGRADTIAVVIARLSRRPCMRIAFVGKGGSGKTTSAAMFSRYLAAQNLPVLAIDADINQHLAQALGHDGPPPPPLGADLLW